VTIVVTSLLEFCVVSLVAFVAYRLGVRDGRRVGYKEGWDHGRIDGQRDLIEASLKFGRGSTKGQRS